MLKSVGDFVAGIMAFHKAVTKPNGGIIYSPTFGLVGEGVNEGNRSKPEVFLTLDEFKCMHALLAEAQRIIDSPRKP